MRNHTLMLETVYHLPVITPYHYCIQQNLPPSYKTILYYQIILNKSTEFDR
nr:MAG TPA: hypothetical protein [Inoviridae sp.]